MREVVVFQQFVVCYVCVYLCGGKGGVAEELLDGTQDLYDGLSEIDANSAALTDGARQVLDTVLETANETLAESEGDFAKLGITLNTLTIDNYASEIDRLQTEMLNNLEDYVIEQAD